MPPCPFDTEINNSSLKSSFQRIQRTRKPALPFSRFLGCGRLSLNVCHHKGCFLKTQTLTTVAQQKGQNRRKSAKKKNSKRAQIQKKVTSMWPFYICGCSCRPLRISQARLLVLVWTPMHLREKSAIPQLAKTCDEHISQKRTLSWVTSANLCIRAET